MTCAIMQPTYLPWLGYFDLIDQVNKFVFLDSVQMAKRSWQVRNRILTKQGELYLTIPIQKQKSRDETLLCDAAISYSEKWIDKHLDSIRFSYAKSPYFAEVFPFVRDLYSAQQATLSEFNIHLIKNISAKIGITTRFYKSSELNQSVDYKKDDLLSAICKTVNADTYLSPTGSAVYIELKQPGGAFIPNGIQLYYQNYKHPIYHQSNVEFTPYMCILDLLFNEGFENSLAIIKSGRRSPYYYEQYTKLLQLNSVNATS